MIFVPVSFVQTASSTVTSAVHIRCPMIAWERPLEVGGEGRLDPNTLYM